MFKPRLFLLLLFALIKLLFSEPNKLAFGKHHFPKSSLYQPSEFLSLSCNTSMSKDFMEKLKPCLDSDMCELINYACRVTEDQMIKTYYSEKPSEFYKSFLYDVTRFSLPSDIMQSTDIISLANRIKTSVYFEEIYFCSSNNKTKESEDIIIKLEDETVDDSEDVEYYYLNPNGRYIKCISKITNNEAVKDYINAIQAAGNISFDLIADALVNSLNDQDYENGVVRSIIIMGIFYPLLLN